MIRPLSIQRRWRIRALSLASAKPAHWQEANPGALIPENTSAANLKFLSVWRQVRDRNFKFKAATQINKLLELL
jgi:hypothetical protein